MIKEIRKQYNDYFSEDLYRHLKASIEKDFPNAIDFRLAETPVFISKDLKDKMLTACEDIIDVVLRSDFKSLTNRSIPHLYNIPEDNHFPEMLVFDFGICENSNGELVPQLVEMQGFPSLFAYQLKLDELFRNSTPIPKNFSSFLNGYDPNSCRQLLTEMIVGNYDPEEVILLELFPEQQKTRIDFKYTEALLAIQTVCLTELIAEGSHIFYFKNGKKIQVKRIFNRVIFDELKKQSAPLNIDLSHTYNVEWIPHPNWYYRISKFTLPFINSPYVPTTYFLNEIKMPIPLASFVLKPLFSYAGKGVNINVTQKDLDAIPDPENWILQKKISYAPIINTPDENAITELRLFYFWKKEWSRPLAVHNLARISKGPMIGTRFQSDKKWVGGTIAFFENDPPII